MRRFAVVVILLGSFAVTVTVVGYNYPFISGVDRSEVGASQQSDVQRMEELRRMIEKEIGEPEAENLSQCKVIPFGAKPCGGPATYLVYSSSKANEAKLKQWVSEYSERQAKYNKERNLMSDCMFVSEPKVKLVNGVCKVEGENPSLR